MCELIGGSHSPNGAARMTTGASRPLALCSVMRRTTSRRPAPDRPARRLASTRASRCQPARQLALALSPPSCPCPQLPPRYLPPAHTPSCCARRPTPRPQQLLLPLRPPVTASDENRRY